MDSVEWVTVHVSQSHSLGGATKVSDVVVVAFEGLRRYFEGARRPMGLDGVPVGAAMAIGVLLDIAEL
jgi:hypothetical protein